MASPLSSPRTLVSPVLPPTPTEAAAQPWHGDTVVVVAVVVVVVVDATAVVVVAVVVAVTIVVDVAVGVATVGAVLQ